MMKITFRLYYQNLNERTSFCDTQNVFLQLEILQLRAAGLVVAVKKDICLSNAEFCEEDIRTLCKSSLRPTGIMLYSIQHENANINYRGVNRACLTPLQKTPIIIR